MRERKSKIEDVFFALLRAGLWEQSVPIQSYCPIDFDALYELAEKQSVVGLLAAGLEHVVDIKVTKQQALPFLKKVFSLEGKNAAINSFIGEMVNNMRSAGIETLLVKGQGVAQCYERPHWRSVGDVDLFLDAVNYDKAKAFLIPSAVSVEKEDVNRKHLGMTIGQWSVELHGTLRGPLLRRINENIDDVQKDTFENKRLRIWMDGNAEVLLPAPDNDIIFVFTHILQHYFGSGIGLRQICDWCRLLWTYRNEIDLELLEKRLSEMRLMSEWQVLCAYASDYLGAPQEAMLLYSPDKCWRRKARMMNKRIMEVGNFGRGRDLSYYQTRPYLIRKAISFKYRLKDAYRDLMIFPMDSILAFTSTLSRGFKAVAKGE